MSDKDKPDQELFYMENGLIVFTEAFHLKRGYCCKSGCRHCPYGQSPKKLSDDKNEDVDQKQENGS
jgi:hypothetical protein